MDDSHPFKKAPLFTWGCILIAAACFTNVITQLLMPIEGNSAAARGQATGRLVALALIFIVGIGLLVAHFVKKLR